MTQRLLTNPRTTVLKNADGQVMHEWHQAGLDIEVHVKDGELDGIYIHDKETGRDWEWDADGGSEA